MGVRKLQNLQSKARTDKTVSQSGIIGTFGWIVGYQILIYTISDILI